MSSYTDVVLAMASEHVLQSMGGLMGHAPQSPASESDFGDKDRECRQVGVMTW
jgi:hypothetical protein